MPLDLVVAADPVLGVFVLLGAAVVVAALPMEEAVLGCAALADELDWGALWQPASAKRTTEASTSFFIIISRKSVGGATAPRPIISNAGAGECKLFLKLRF